jgi:hypothetical protein
VTLSLASTILREGGLVADKIVMSLIALLQAGTCALLLSIEFMAYGGGFRPVVTPYLLLGLINGLLLFSRRRTSRIIAMGWLAIFAGFVLLSPVNWASPSDRFVVVTALMDLLAIAYLYWSTFAAEGKKRWQEGREAENGNTV